jgi:hypothetical protein
MTENYLIIDESGLYVVGYVVDNTDVKYIAYSNRDSCSIGLLDYVTALKRKELLEKSQQKLIRQNKINSNHTFYIIKA